MSKKAALIISGDGTRYKLSAKKLSQTVYPRRYLFLANFSLDRAYYFRQDCSEEFPVTVRLRRGGVLFIGCQAFASKDAKAIITAAKKAQPKAKKVSR